MTMLTPSYYWLHTSATMDIIVQNQIRFEREEGKIPLLIICLHVSRGVFVENLVKKKKKNDSSLLMKHVCVCDPWKLVT